MTRRLLGARRQDSPLLAVLGASHVVRAPVGGIEPVALLLEAEVPGVANGVLAPSSGRFWFHGEQEVLSGPRPPVDVVVPLGVASPAVVP